MKKKLNFTGSRAVKYLLGLLVLLVIIDGIITNILINKNIAHESNPFLWGIAGQDLLVVIKIIGATVCAFILWDIYKHWPKLAIFSIYTAVVVYFVIVLWNLFLFI